MKTLPSILLPEDKQRRLALNRAAAIKSRKKKKKEEEELRQHVDFMTRAIGHLQDKLQAYERLVEDQTRFQALLKTQIGQLARENEEMSAGIKASRL